MGLGKEEHVKEPNRGLDIIDNNNSDLVLKDIKERIMVVSKRKTSGLLL